MKRSLLRAIIPAALAAGVLVAPASAFATTPVVAHNGEVHGCAVAAGNLKWGFKESFRSYISGTIARGQWVTSDGAGYEIPQFVWSNAQGEFDPETGAGAVSFTGTVQFTGHEGTLNLTVANPTIEIAADGSGRVLADMRGNDTDGNLKIDAVQAELALLGNLGVINTEQPEHQFIDVAATLSPAGVDGFGGFYEAGSALDPLSLTLTLGECAPEEAQVVEPEPETEVVETEVVTTQQTATDGAGTPWLPIGIGAGVVVVAGVITGVVLNARKKRLRDSAAEVTTSAPE